jgi:3',5'-cyclic AMP phosphodiesterase CpdA
MFSAGKKIVVAITLIFFIFGPAATAFEAKNTDYIPYCISVTFAGDPQNCRGFTWYTDAECNSNLLLTEAADKPLNVLNNARLYQGKSIRLERRTGWEASCKKVSVHQLELTGLKPDTTYVYKVGDVERGIWSDRGTFKTAAAQEDVLHFVIIADSQGEDEQANIKNAQTLQAAMATMPEANFLVHMGDFVQSYGSDDSYENFAQWQQFFATARTELMNTTIMPVAGNHDMTSNVFCNHFALNSLIPEGTDIETGAYYAVDYANTCFIILNTNENYQNGNGEISAQQIKWLKDTAARADQAGQTWKILLLHRGIYSFGRHMDSADIVALRAQLAPLISDLGIDLVLQGHDHVYMRSQILAKSTSGQIEPPNERLKISPEIFQGVKTDYIVDPPGTTYIIPNVSGNQFGFRKNSRQIDVYPAAEYKSDDNDEPIFAGISIDGRRLCYRAWAFDREGDGQVKEIDRYAILKSEESTFGPPMLFTDTYYAMKSKEISFEYLLKNLF